MNKTIKIILLVAAIIVILLIIYFVFFNKKSDYEQVSKTLPTTTTPFNVSSCSLTDDASLNWNKTLQKGSVGCEVARLQKEMNKNITFPYSLLVVDGYFGTYTESELYRQKGEKVTTLNFYKGFNFQ